MRYFAGGSFPHPPVAAQLCTLLPPPACFRGPFVNVDLLMDIFTRIHLPDTVPQPSENGGDVRLFDLAKSVHWIVEEGGGVGIKRKKRLGISMDGSDDEDMPLPPTNDIYRQRQQKRVK
jgi:cleavage stimulation factor subunit 3